MLNPLLNAASQNYNPTMTQTNEQLFTESQHYIPGGVNSPVRAFKSVGGTPKFMQRGKGAYLWDAEGKRYIDYIGSWGPMIVGHAHAKVVAALQARAALGTSFGTPTELELELAKAICRLMPSIEQVRLVNSGTEATMSSIRLARGYTQRDVIIKFEGCYHGHVDGLLVKAGSGALTFSQPSSAGVPEQIAGNTLVLPYNDIQAIETAFQKYPEQIAAVILEPIAGNMNLLIPSREFLLRLRELCTQLNTVLIFDEVMTGFRVNLHGAQHLFEITPDLTAIGKVIGGGMPLAAFGGKREIMQLLSPVGPVYQAGTLSGNPMAVTAGLKTLELIQQPLFFETLAQTTKNLCDGLIATAKAAGIAFNAQSVGGMFGFYFAEAIPQTLADIQANDHKRFNQFFHSMLAQGVYLAPSSYEAGFVSAAHGETEITATIDAAKIAFAC